MQWMVENDVGGRQFVMIRGFQGFPQNSLNHVATVVLLSWVIASFLSA
jgi:hypothetical protein